MGEEISRILRTICQEEIAKAKDSIRAEMVAMEEARKGPRYYTRDQVCDCLKCSHTTFHRLANAGLIPTTKVGKRVLIPADEFDSLQKSGIVHKYARAK